ncbi:MAG: DUF5688 family protein [Lachnospiraceae bacterium]|nr:DUF5688 family protein [Lachnospiraceae bacterium]
MDYKEFLSRMAENLKERLPDAEISIQSVNKLQGLSYEGICIRANDRSIGETMNMEPFYQAFMDGASYGEIIRQVAQVAEEHMALIPELDSDPLSDYSQVKGMLTVDVVGKELNGDMLEQIPHRDMEDLSVVYRIVVGEIPDMGRASVVVTNEMLNRYGVTPEQLHQDALENAARSKPAMIRGMQDVISEMMPVDMPMPGAEPAVPFLVATNSDMFHGAGVIAYPDFMEQASKMVDGDFFILPSSVHEVLILKDGPGMDYKDLEEMVSEVNGTMVSQEDKLSDHVYHYDAKEKVFERADKFAARSRGEMQKDSVLDELKKLGKQVEQKKLAEPARDQRNMPNRTANVSL